MPRRHTYIAWRDMRRRCNKRDDKDYKYYGARGIRVCPRWENSFAAFLKDMGERPENLTLDRIDNDGNYEPGNCRWATIKEQNANKRRFCATREDGVMRAAGVSKVKKSGRYRAYAYVRSGGLKKQVHIGSFATQSAATQAVAEWHAAFRA